MGKRSFRFAPWTIQSIVESCSVSLVINLTEYSSTCFTSKETETRDYILLFHDPSLQPFKMKNRLDEGQELYKSTCLQSDRIFVNIPCTNPINSCLIHKMKLDPKLSIWDLHISALNILPRMWVVILNWGWETWKLRQTPETILKLQLE